MTELSARAATDPSAIARSPAVRRRRLAGVGRRAVLTDDLVVGTVSATAGVVAAYESGVPTLLAVGVLLAIHILWVVLLSSSRTVAVPLLRLGSAEFRHVFQATLVVYGLVAIVHAFTSAPILLAALRVSLPTALVGVLLGRVLWGRRLRTHPSELLHTPTLIVGGYFAARAIASALDREQRSGAVFVGVCLPAAEAEAHEAVVLPNGTRIPVVGTDEAMLAAIETTGARAVALTPTDRIGPGDLRRLIWELDERCIELVLSPGVVDVAGHRVVYQAMSEMPMLSIARPQHHGAASVAKRAFDIVVAAFALLVTLPITLAVAIAIRIDSRGPLFYTAERVGAGGRTFKMIKFRSMVDGAEHYRDALADKDIGAGVLFKIPDDPRVTRVGRLLRRYSLDELPQFLNVLTGDMSVVGPRPALPTEVAAYPPVMRRRHLVRPGITGAWQVSGRSDLSWDESIRLDIGYVENWSLLHDLSIVTRTVRTVVKSSGAY